jgi:hypothetical protein
MFGYLFGYCFTSARKIIQVFFIIFGYFLRDSDWNGFLFQSEGDDEKKIQLFIS